MSFVDVAVLTIFILNEFMFNVNCAVLLYFYMQQYVFLVADYELEHFAVQMCCEFWPKEIRTRNLFKTASGCCKSTRPNVVSFFKPKMT